MGAVWIRKPSTVSASSCTLRWPSRCDEAVDEGLRHALVAQGIEQPFDLGGRKMRGDAFVIPQHVLEVAAFGHGGLGGGLQNVVGVLLAELAGERKGDCLGHDLAAGRVE